jgi:ABC-type glycerol-3-phosphate transport system substrate-binding protein
MKTTKLIGLLLTTLTLTGCSGLFGDLSGSTSQGGSTQWPTSTSQTQFDISKVLNGANVIKELGDSEKGVSINFVVSSYQDGEELINYDIALNRLQQFEWATLHAKSFVPGAEYNEKVSGLIERKDEGGIDVYYSLDQKEYTYFGNAYNPDINFDIDQLENYLAVDPTYIAALAAVGNGTIEYIAGKQCLTFSIAGELINEYYPGSELKISFDLETSLLMKLELTTFTTDSYGVPVMNQYNVKVKKIGKAEQLPKMFR